MSLIGGIQDGSDIVNERSPTDADPAAERDVIEDKKSSNQLRAFARAPARKSLGNNTALLGWLDAQERLQNRLDSNQVCYSNMSLGIVLKVNFAVGTVASVLLISSLTQFRFQQEVFYTLPTEGL